MPSLAALKWLLACSAILYFYFQIVQVKYQGQTRKTRILDHKLLYHCNASCAMRVENVSKMAFIFSVFSTMHWKNYGKAFCCELLWGYTIAMITTHATGHWIWAWSWIFSLHIFRLMLIQQIINLRKKRTENLQYITDLLDQNFHCRSENSRWLV